MEGTTVDDAVITFRSHMLKAIVTAKTPKEANSVDDGLSAFLRAQKMVESATTERILTPAGLYLVNIIHIRPDCVGSAKLYEHFLGTVKGWSGHHRSIQIQSMLWLHHPTEPTALPAFAYIKDLESLRWSIPQWEGRRKFLVHLCLGAARQLLAEKRYYEAQFALQFARDKFPDLVEPQLRPLQPAAEAKGREQETAADLRRREEASLKMLDGLLPT
jgi:hypothetical protein